jgi:hypothetical protein
MVFVMVYLSFVVPLGHKPIKGIPTGIAM